MTQTSQSRVMDPSTQMNTYQSYVTMIGDPTAKNASKLDAAKELSENFEVIVSSPQYPVFLQHSIRIFLDILQKGKPQYISEHNVHALRKLLLEMIYRMPPTEQLRPHVDTILSMCMKLLELENEQNVLVCLRIIIELHKHFRPAYNPEIQHFLQFVRSIYQHLPEHLDKIFEPRDPVRVKDLTEVNLDALLPITYTSLQIQIEKKLPDGKTVKDTYTLIPKGVLSLKVLQELPIIVVLMYQLYKQNVQQEVNDYIPIIIGTITLKPADHHRANPNFNKEVFVDFMGAQIKTLSFLAYIIRIYQQVVGEHSQMMVEGILSVLTLCPSGVTQLRKELLIAARHILATDLRIKFVPFMEKLFDESVLLGKGWTTHESLRPLAYSTLGDLVHHVRQHLPMSDLAHAVHLFSNNVHDETLPTSIQIISCKVLLNLVDCICQRSEVESSQGHESIRIGKDLLMRMLEVFVTKFKTIAKLHLPILIQKTKAQQAATPPQTGSAAATSLDISKTEDNKSSITSTVIIEPLGAIKTEDKDTGRFKFGFPPSMSSSYTVADCKSLVKTLVRGVKAITWKFATFKQNSACGEGAKLFNAKETQVFIRLVKWAMQALDIYTLTVTPNVVQQQGQRPLAQQTVRNKEEREDLEHFAGVFSVLDSHTFGELFATTIDYMVERFAHNSALQTVGNTFLSTQATAPIFATVLVEYLLGRMEEMGNGNLERSNLYLKLFKLVFGSVHLFAAANEHMLKPHLHQIVNRSMELAMTAKEPYNYFLLLRALFRSIGGGHHDLLYQEFLPLLPNLLQGLNSLQSGLHKQHMKDLFVELCLTVPVRLSSLLPCLPLLMDPLVSALNGSHTLISQGLRTLELCVDNLQPDFLHEHIQPVRAELMQALWRTLRNPADQEAHVAFRILGKFGGRNRKMMIEPQRLEYTVKESAGPAVVVHFPDQSKPIELGLAKIIETAVNTMKHSATELFYRRQAWDVIRSFLIASIKLEDDMSTVQKLFMHPTFLENKISMIQGLPYKFSDKLARQTHVNALTGMFVGVATKDLKSAVQPTMIVIVRHYTMVSVSQEAGPFSLNAKQVCLEGSMDAFVLIDALEAVMGHEEKEWCKPGQAALALMLQTATTILGTKDRACRLPLFEYLAERMCSLCYDRAWYSRLGGCIAIAFLCERMSIRWIYQHLLVFVKAQLFVMMDLTGEVSSGAIDKAKYNLENMLKMCATANPDPGLANIQMKALNEVTYELIRQVTSPTDLLRQQAMYLLQVFADIQNKTVIEVMKPHKDELSDMIPPKKHLLRHQAANIQIGLMEGNTFCTTLSPRLFALDLNVSEHRIFFQEVKSLCDVQDISLQKLPCYKNIQSLVPLRKAAMRALAACHYLPNSADKDKIFQTLYQALERPNPQLQEAAFQCMKTFVAGSQVDMTKVQGMMRPLLLTLGDYRNLKLSGAMRLSYLVQLFPDSFKETLCDQLLQFLRDLLDILLQAQKGVSKNRETEKIITTIINIFQQIPAAGPKFIDILCQLVLNNEKSMLIGPSSPFREPLMKFLLRFPGETVQLFLQDNNIKDDQWSRYLQFLICHTDGEPFRAVVQNVPSVERLINMASAPSNPQLVLTAAEKIELRYQSIRIVSLLVKFDDQWLFSQHRLANTLRDIWCSDQYQERHKKIESVDCHHWKEPKLLVKILLHFFSHHPTNIDLLFQLLRAVCDRFLPDFTFLRDFLENTVAGGYTVAWKRSAFFRFVELFPEPAISQELKAKILQLIIIPCFAVCFERGEGEKVVGSSAQESPDNIISVFIKKVIEQKNATTNADCVRILLLQFSCVLVDQALSQSENTANKTNNNLRCLMNYAWSCFGENNCVDPASRYHGHLVLSHVFAKFALHKQCYQRVFMRVFHELLKAHAIEVRQVVRQALEVLIPAMPIRIKDGYEMLTHWTKKIIVEEGHSMQQLFHILQLVVRHYKVYYPVRHTLVQHMVNATHRLGFSASATIEYRELAVELAEVIVKWELQRIKDESEVQVKIEGSEEAATDKMDDDSPWKQLAVPGPSGSPSSVGPVGVNKEEFEMNKPIDRVHADAVINFLIKLACQVNETSSTTTTTTGLGSPGELLSRRCVTLLKMALKPEVWPQQNVNLRLQWLDKVFMGADDTNKSCNVCTALELFTFLLGVMKKEQILVTVKPLQRGIAACISNSNSKVLRLTHGLLCRLMAVFPIETSNTTSAGSKHEELDFLYICVGNVIVEGLNSYEKNSAASSQSLFGPLMMLKAACSSNPGYVDGLVVTFVRVAQRLAREHLNTTTNDNSQVSVTSDLLILSLDLVKNRVGMMTVDTRKTFIGTILVGLIEKTQDVKVMKAICKMIEEWMKVGKNGCAVVGTNQVTAGPSLREKSILLVKMMQYVEKRFHDLNTQFLELVNSVYRDESLKTSELTVKLEPAFLSGLRCTQPQIRAKFFEILDGSMKRRLNDRLMYITSSQNWEPMGQHFWLKQCIELILVTGTLGNRIQLTTESGLLPSLSSVIVLADPVDKENFLQYTRTNEDPNMDFDMVEPSESPIEKEDMELCFDVKEEGDRKVAIKQLVVNQAKFLEKVKDMQTNLLLEATAQLCHLDTPLAESVWLDMFPSLWAILTTRQQESLTGEIMPFLVSGSHVIQKDLHPSSIAVFFEALCHCNPPVSIKPNIMSYLGKSHNLWHRMILNLERLAVQQAQNKSRRDPIECYDFEPDTPPQQNILDFLAEMYITLREEDMWCGLWQKHAKYRETTIALAYEQQGFFEQALGAYELALEKCRQDYASNPAPITLMCEQQLWERQWIRCSKELNQWEQLNEFGKIKNHVNPYLILDCAWRVPDWNMMKEALSHVENHCPNDMLWKIRLYRGFLAICSSDEQDQQLVERLVKTASATCMREWRRLPHVVSHVHLPLLQASQQIVELQEASQIRHGVQHERTNTFQDLKAIVKTWRNRLPVIADDLSHWSDVFTWRQHHYQFILSHYGTQIDNTQPVNNNQAMLGVHASAQALIHFGKISRKHGLTGVCLDSLSRIYTMPNISVADSFQKIRQTIKCYLQMAAVSGINELHEALEVVKLTNVKHFKKDMTAEFYALKGMLLSHLGMTEDANKAFSAAVQMADTLVKAWALWGDFMEQQFTKGKPPNVATGVAAIICFLHACRHQNESKPRKYLAKVLWLLTYDDDKFTLAEAVDKYVVGVPPVQWLPWIPQLLTCLVRSEGKLMLNLLSQVGRTYPQAVYFPLRTLYLTLKIEQRERYKSSAEYAASLAGIQNQGAHAMVDAQQRSIMTGQAPTPEQLPMKATPSMLRCSHIMRMQREIHPTILSSLEGVVDQVMWFRENWYEEVLRQLRQGLAKCYVVAFENRKAVNDATITPHTLHFVEKLVSTFGIGVENISSSVNSSSSSCASESLARRAQVILQDPVFQRMKSQFKAEFDFAAPGAMKLHNLIHKLKKWIKILEAKTKLLPKCFLIEEKCRFLSNFSLQTAEVELPGEFLLPKHSHYFVRISRFMPRVEIVQKHNTAARRLFIRGHNGKIYPYLVVNDSGLGDARKEERVLQLLRMLNHYLAKQKETSRRFLHFTVPRVVAVSSHMRLVEDNPASISLLDIYKAGCTVLNTKHDTPVTRYYERLAMVQARGAQPSYQHLRDILRDVQATMVPRTILHDWARRTFPSPTDYWTFRKMLTLQMSLACFAEYVLHLTRLNPDMMYIHQDSGLLNVAYFKFDVDDSKGELDSNRPVPFRLTPNLQELLTDIGISGPLTASIIATARCLTHPNFNVQTILRAILRDEMIASHKKKQEEEANNVNTPPTDVPGELIVTMVTRAVSAISQRLNSLANFDGTDSKVSMLVAAAKSCDNLCRMDPAWHPWL